MIGDKVRVQRRLSLALLSAGLSLGAVTGGAAPYVFINIDVPGAFQTNPKAINASGQVVGQYWVLLGQNSNAFHAFHWDKGVLTTIDPPGTASYAIATDINESGQVVGSYQDSNRVFHGFLWENGTFTTIDGPGGGSATLAAINAAGQIVGNGRSPTTGKGAGFLWDQGTFTTIEVEDFFVLDTGVSGINAAGQVIGGYLKDPDFTGAFVWEDGTFNFIGPGDRLTSASAINDSGQIVGIYDPSGQGLPTAIHAFLIPSANNDPNIDPPGAVPDEAFPGFAAFVAYASDINAAGSVVGSYYDGTQYPNFLLQGGTYTRVDAPTALGTGLDRINSAGDIIGTYVTLSGRHGYLARPASLVTGLAHLNSTTTSFNATPVPGGPAGTFTIVASFTNTSSTPIDTPQFSVDTLSNGNRLLNADAPPGTVGARRTPDPGSDGIWSPGETLDVEFVVGLQKRLTFRFQVGLLGIIGL